MADKKITKRERFEFAKSVVLAHPELFAEIPDMAEFIDHEIDLLSRKNSKSATLSPSQKDTLAIAEIVKDILAEVEDNKGMTVGAILKDERIKSYVCANGDSVSSQKITAIFTKDTVSDKNPNGAFIRTVEKKVAYYSLNYGVEGEGEGE